MGLLKPARLMRERSALRRNLTGFALLAGAAAPALNAQTIHSTFGPGDSYLTGGYIVLAGQPIFPGLTIWPAAQFTYGGPGGLLLSTIRIAAAGANSGSGPGDATVSFLNGPDIASASVIESWNLVGWANNVPQIFSFSSLTSYSFATGNTYWLRITTGPSGMSAGTWLQNDQGVLGRSYLHSGVGTWLSDAALSPVWDVTAVPAVTTPEPASIALCAIGLAGLAGARLLRRRWGRPPGRAQTQRHDDVPGRAVLGVETRDARSPGYTSLRAE